VIELTKTTVLEKQKRLVSFLICILSYVIALGVAIGIGFALHPRIHPIFTALVADIAATLVIYLYSSILKNTSLYDPYWSLIPLVIGMYWLFTSTPTNEITLRQIVVLVLVCVWGLRLTFNWARGWQGLHHEDWRYTKFRDDKPKLFWFINLTGLQMMPTILVFLGCLSLYPALTSTLPTFNILTIFGIVIVTISILLETIADEQLRNFSKIKEKGEIFTAGLWKFSRHPNYLGEISFWWGLWFFALAINPSVYWWMIVGPVSITILFVGISIPLMEKYLIKKYPTYDEYQKKVSMILPWFAKKE
jgi:steroid 5-alpha reductase family enzyme